MESSSGSSSNTMTSDRVADIVLDASGNILSTGYFQDTVDFDPGGGSFSIISNGSLDCFVQKLDARGKVLTCLPRG